MPMKLLPPFRLEISEDQREDVIKAPARLFASYLARTAADPSLRSDSDDFTEIQNSGYTAQMESKVVQVRGRGTVTLPARIRSRYALADGDPMTILDLDGVLVLSPKLSVVSKMAAEIERLADKAEVGIETLLEGQAEQRKKSRSKT